MSKLFLKAKQRSKLAQLTINKASPPKVVKNEEHEGHEVNSRPNLINRAKLRLKLKPKTHKKELGLETVPERIISKETQTLKLKPNPPPQQPKIDLWAEKYRPQTLDQIVGNCDQIVQIRDWFKRLKNNDKTIQKALLFSGCPGTSKTTIAHAVLKEFGYSVKEYNASDIRSKKLVEMNLTNLITNEQVDKQFKKNFRPFGIVMDEVDGMSSGDRGGLAQLIKIINPNRGLRSVKNIDKEKVRNRWIPPIICICNKRKKVSDLKKDCLEIHFNKPSISELSSVITRVSKSENLNFTEDGKKVLAELAQGDFRRLMFLLQNFSTTNQKSKPVNAQYVYEYYDFFCKKNLDLTYYQVTDRILNKTYSVDETLKMFEIDKNLLPMMIHENYLKFINAQCTNFQNKVNNCKNSIDSIIVGDMIEKMMYNTQCWYLRPLHGLSACYVPSYYSNLHNKISPGKSQYTNTLIKFSSQRANIKNIKNLNAIVSQGQLYRTDDIHLMSDVILFNLLDPKGDRKLGIEYLISYNLSVNDLEKLIKTNKLSNKYKQLYKSIIKNQLKKLYQTRMGKRAFIKEKKHKNKIDKK